MDGQAVIQRALAETGGKPYPLAPCGHGSDGPGCGICRQPGIAEILGAMRDWKSPGHRSES